MSGKPIDEAVRALPVSWSDFWMQQGDRKTSHDYLAFEKALHWLNANLDALTAAQQQACECRNCEVCDGREAIAAQQQGQAVETVGFVRENSDGGRYIDWTVEGGIGALEDGEELIVSAARLTDDTGAGTVYTAPPPSVPEGDVGGVMHRALCRIALGQEPAQLIADEAIAEARKTALATQHQEPKS